MCLLHKEAQIVVPHQDLPLILVILKVKDQDYQSWRNLHKAVDDVTHSAVGLSGQMVKLGAIAPAKGLLSVF